MIKKTYLTLIIVCLSFLVSFSFAKADICPFNQSLEYGDENSIVKELQNFLSLDKEVYSGPITGYYGNLTIKGVKAFQKKTGLLQNGKVDLATATVLCQLYISYKTSNPISNENLDVDNSCFLKTNNLCVGYYDDATEEVLELQKWLADRGFYPEKVFTGYFGALTKKAVQRFQKSQGIIQTGIVGVKTTAAICDNENYSQTSSYNLTNPDLIISGIDVNPTEINVGSKVNIRFKEENIANVESGNHITSLFINEEEVSKNNISKLKSGEEVLAVNYEWTCEKEGIYIFKFFVDSQSDLIESNKYNNVLVLPVNCGGVSNDFKYSCNTKSGECEIDSSGSMTLDECSKSCKIGDQSLPDLYIKSFSPTRIKIGETLPLIITERNDGNNKAGKHKYTINVEFNGQNKAQEALFGDIDSKSEQSAKGSWQCKAAGVYSITINVDPDNSILESNETNNIKTFKIQCSDENGKVPTNDESDGEKNDSSGKSDDSEKSDDSGSKGKPDLCIDLTPKTLSKGGNDIKISLFNSSKVDVTDKFDISIVIMKTGNKKAKENTIEIKGLKAGKENGVNGSLFKEPVQCNPESDPFELIATVDSRKVIPENNENNNIVKIKCGDINSKKDPDPGDQDPDDPPSEPPDNNGSKKEVNLNGFCSINPGKITITDKSSENSTVCLTPYISDLNKKCNDIDYDIKIKVNGKTVRTEKRKNSNKTVCLTHKEVKDKLSSNGNYTIEAEVIASCKYNNEKYELKKNCTSTVNYTGSGSNESKGSLYATCSVSPSSPKVGDSVNFKVNVSKIGFSNNQCSKLNYKWNDCNSTTSNCSKSFSSSGTKSIKVYISCADDANIKTSTQCSVKIGSSGGSDGGYNPNPTTPIERGKLDAVCKCGNNGCNVTISGGGSDYNDYSCTWVLDGKVKQYVSTCKGINSSNFKNASVTVVEDSTGERVTVTCTK